MLIGKIIKIVHPYGINVAKFTSFENYGKTFVLFLLALGFDKEKKTFQQC
jgi:hypothetical protein